MSSDLTDDTTAIPNDGMSRRASFDPIPVNAETNALYGRVHDTVKRAAPEIDLTERYGIALDITRLILDMQAADRAGDERIEWGVLFDNRREPLAMSEEDARDFKADKPEIQVLTRRVIFTKWLPTPTVVLASTGQETE